MFKRGGSASSRGKKRPGWEGELGSPVTGMQCRISPCSGRAKGESERRTPRGYVVHVGRRTQPRDARLACRPSHESKLFVTGEGGHGHKEGGHTCLLTISGRSCRGSYRVLLIRDMNLILL